MSFPLTEFPLEITVRILEFGVQQSYCSLCLVSRSTRDVILSYAISALIFYAENVDAASRILQFLEKYPDVTHRLHHLRLVYYWSSDIPRYIQYSREILRLCPNISSLSIYPHFLRHTINELPTFSHHRITTMYLSRVEPELLMEFCQNPRSRLLFSQLKYLVCEKQFDIESLPQEVTRNPFQNLTHFAFDSDFPNEQHKLTALHDRYIFPALQQIIFKVPNRGRRYSREHGLTGREMRYQLLMRAKEWELLYLVFDPTWSFPLSTYWIDMGGAFWDEAVRLVTYGDSNGQLEDPPEWPDADVSAFHFNSRLDSDTSSNRFSATVVVALFGEKNSIPVLQIFLGL